ncbi:hypothetical protein WDU99_07300 [Microbacterium sp. Mu-80]|uniref:Preprotein translocase subunit SecE n=1 Tax=Microbacterium bandirmense TaxID=3122050 RepID=A0ABU8L9Z5_9MICO
MSAQKAPIMVQICASFMNPTLSSSHRSLNDASGLRRPELTAMSDRENRTGDRLDRMEERLTKIELNMAENVRPRTPWYVWVAGIGAVILLGVNGFALLDLLGSIAEALP